MSEWNLCLAAPPMEHGPVRLEPLAAEHAADLAEAVVPGELWRTWYASVPAPEAVGEEIERRLQKQAEGDIAAWAVVERRTGSAVGMTTYLNFDLAHRRLEIGSTWLGQKVQGTGINPAMKLLLLQRAFEELGCIAVEFRTHWHNHQSRAAIARLGAKQDGVLRNHRILPDGTLRDTVVFSILDSEWPAVKAGLHHRLTRR
ncbi:GNAT family N-acetyltransferase [Nesterenkonia sp. NBAIMH1]|uniref:GNAT family N-acetyltransferase n=1 Tax=Nesterenkonia sp. NBAIMH1 TaxID=2600320 RepID=UPI001FEEB2F1|nr:GNAT family protein [Nesterenkonia sp. NBAIMH1]